MDNKYLVLWLEAPLQSWGVDSKFNRRDTIKFPTKSGIFGLILCGLGASGPQVELLGKLAQGQMSVLSFVRAKARKDNKSIEKINNEPLLRDFQMVGSGYDDKDIWQRLLIPKTSEGKPAVGGGAKLTYRYYLQDARFAVILEIENDLKLSLTKAFQEPVYDLYLGRKSCVPTDFIYRGVFESFNEAQEVSIKIAEDKKLIPDFKVLDGEFENEGDVITLNDVPIQFGEVKKYRDRRVTIVS